MFTGGLPPFKHMKFPLALSFCKLTIPPSLLPLPLPCLSSQVVSTFLDKLPAFLKNRVLPPTTHHHHYHHHHHHHHRHYHHHHHHHYCHYLSPPPQPPLSPPPLLSLSSPPPLSLSPPPTDEKEGKEGSLTRKEVFEERQEVCQGRKDAKEGCM